MSSHVFDMSSLLFVDGTIATEVQNLEQDLSLRGVHINRPEELLHGLGLQMSPDLIDGDRLKVCSRTSTKPKWLCFCG